MQKHIKGLVDVIVLQLKGILRLLRGKAHFCEYGNSGIDHLFNGTLGDILPVVMGTFVIFARMENCDVAIRQRVIRRYSLVMNRIVARVDCCSSNRGSSNTERRGRP